MKVASIQYDHNWLLLFIEIGPFPLSSPLLSYLGKFSTCYTGRRKTKCPGAPDEEDLNARELLRRADSAGPVSPTCFNV
jgi:hypothetical protein